MVLRYDCVIFNQYYDKLNIKIKFLEDGTRVMTIPKIRVVHQNGSLIFLPFGPSSYMHDVHSAQYRCKASNTVGQIISGAVHINAGMNINVFFKLFIIRYYDIKIP